LEILDNVFNFLPIPTFFYIKAILDHSKFFIVNIESFNLYFLMKIEN